MTADNKPSIDVTPDKDVAFNLGVLEDAEIQVFYSGDTINVRLPFPSQSLEDYFMFEFKGPHDKTPAFAFYRMDKEQREHLIKLGENLAMVLKSQTDSQKSIGVKKLLTCYGEAIVHCHRLGEKIPRTNIFLESMLQSVNLFLDRYPYLTT